MSEYDSVKENSSKLKNVITQEKKYLEQLDLVHKLIEAKVGDPGRLDYIKVTLENNSPLYESDKQYFEEKSKQFQQIVEIKRKTELTLQALNILHETAVRDSERLNAIKKALQEGKLVAESEIAFLNVKHEALKQEIDLQNRTKWTIDVIKRLHEEEIGDYARLASIKAALEEGRKVDQREISYLKEKYKILQQVDANKKIQWSIDIINKLQKAEIGNYEHLESIKAALVERKYVHESEISYLVTKYKQFLMIKQSKGESDKNKAQDIEGKEIYKEDDTLLTEISELAKNEN